MSDVPQQTQHVPSPQDLPPEAIEFAHQLFNMAREGNLQLVDYVKAGIPPNLMNDEGNTLLMLSAYAGHADLTRKLLELGASPNRQNDKNQSPLAGAVFKGHFDVAKALVDHQANPKVGTPNAVDCAKMFKQHRFLELFGEPEAAAQQTEAPATNGSG